MRGFGAFFIVLGLLMLGHLADTNDATYDQEAKADAVEIVGDQVDQVGDLDQLLEDVVQLHEEGVRHFAGEVDCTCGGLHFQAVDPLARSAPDIEETESSLDYGTEPSADTTRRWGAGLRDHPLLC